MKKLEKITAKKVAKILRAARKQRSLTQGQIASQMNVSQSLISKFESAELIPSVHEWFSICELTQIDSDSHIAGYLDFGRKVNCTESTDFGSFRLPKRYSDQARTSVRTIIPYVKFFADELGEGGVESLLREHKVDPDFFVTLDNSISIRLELDLLKALDRLGLSSNESIQKLTRYASDPKCHGKLQRFYDESRDSFGLVHEFVAQTPFYDSCFELKVNSKSENSIHLEILPTESWGELESFEKKELGEKICQMRRSYFEQFSTYRGNRGTVVKELECQFKNSKRCLFHLETM